MLFKILENLLAVYGLRRSKRRANFPVLRKISFVQASFTRVPNLHAAPKKHWIKMRIYLLSFVETPRKFIIAELSIRKLGSSSVLIMLGLGNPNPNPNLT